MNKQRIGGGLAVTAALGFACFAAYKADTHFTRYSEIQRETQILKTLERKDRAVLSGKSSTTVDMLIRAVGVCKSKGMLYEFRRELVTGKDGTELDFAIECTTKLRGSN
jgi:hypothetical protein